MGVLTKGHTFADGDQVTSSKLNNLVDDAAFTANAITGTTLALSGGKLKVNSITATELSAGCVGTTAIATGAVVEAKIGTGAVTADKYGDLSIAEGKIATNAVTTVKIADANITASKLSGAQSGSAPVFGARAFVSFDATRNAAGSADTNNTTRYIYSSGNVTSVTKTATGLFTVLMTTALADANYTVVSSALIDGAGPRFASNAATNNTTTTFQVEVENVSGNDANAETISAVVFK